ncbi:MAG: copper amine oxidase N-terminal domain-containing protein [Clostridiales bacterium]|nr:copper amine oxidase N-terminal domain-containing protein [Clostridiales bacterium]
MKRTKRVVALLAVASMSLGAFTAVYAEEEINYVKVYEGSSSVNETKEGTPAETEKIFDGSNSVNDTKEGTPAEDTEVVYNGAKSVNDTKEGTPAEEYTQIYGEGSTIASSTQQEAVTVDNTYGPLGYESKYFYSPSGLDMGSYPVITDADVLNDRIALDLLKLYNGEIIHIEYPPFNVSAGESSVVQYNKAQEYFEVSFDAPVDFGRYAYVTIYVDYQEATAKLTPETISLTYYVDKEGMVETTRGVYEKAVTDAKAAEEAAIKAAEEAALAEEEVKEEVVLVPVRVLAEQLGYTVSWEPVSKAVVVAKDDFKVSFATDVNEYLVGEEIVELEVAPTLVDGVMHVPNTFFSKVLDVELVLGEDGTVSIPEETPAA